jgi:hypothetical protein
MAGILRYIYSKLSQVSEGLDTEETFVDQITGSPQAETGTAIITFGGPLVNPITKHAESNQAIGGRAAPIRYEKNDDTNWFIDSNGYHIAGLPSDQLEDRDFFLIQVMQDIRGRNIMICYGFGWKGTLAVGKYFESVIYNNLSARAGNNALGRLKWERFREHAPGRRHLHPHCQGTLYRIRSLMI